MFVSHCFKLSSKSWIRRIEMKFKRRISFLIYKCSCVSIFLYDLSLLLMWHLPPLAVEFLTGIRTLTKYGVTDGEVSISTWVTWILKVMQHSYCQFFFFLLQICLIANVCPESVDEVFALVPTLKVWHVWLCNFFGELYVRPLTMPSLCLL